MTWSGLLIAATLAVPPAQMPESEIVVSAPEMAVKALAMPLFWQKQVDSGYQSFEPSNLQVVVAGPIAAESLIHRCNPSHSYYLYRKGINSPNPEVYAGVDPPGASVFEYFNWYCMAVNSILANLCCCNGLHTVRVGVNIESLIRVVANYNYAHSCRAKGTHNQYKKSNSNEWRWHIIEQSGHYRFDVLVLNDKARMIDDTRVLQARISYRNIAIYSPNRILNQVKWQLNRLDSVTFANFMEIGFNERNNDVQRECRG